MIRERIEERLQGLDRRELAGLGVIAAVIVAGAVFWYVRSLPSQVEISTTSTGPQHVAAAPTAGPTPSAAVLLVHVAGWVRNPGVYELHQGDRVIDALEAAGGAKPGADLTTINLAALLTDAEQVVVAKEGAGGPGPPASGTSAGGSAGGPGDLVNINTATLDQLETLPGIGEVLAQRIIDYREEHGPYGSVEDLLNVSGIGDKTLADLEPHITV
ncbi:MAG TPA: ComEA family DNA-binding protein [Actinomycetota bacterium]|nr:ComEA family DNA-binding protein [Actinomycetota bacterium]